MSLRIERPNGRIGRSLTSDHMHPVHRHMEAKINTAASTAEKPIELNTHLDVFDLIENGKLPRYLPSLWREKNGYDPRFMRKLWNVKTQNLIISLLFIPAGGSGMILVDRITPSTAFAIIPTWALVTTIIVCLAYVAFACIWRERLEDTYCRFTCSIQNLFGYKAMKPSEFPQNVAELKALYWMISVDLARLILQLEQDRAANLNAIDGTHCRLKDLLDDARGFGFESTRKSDMREIFESARTSTRYKVINPRTMLAGYEN